MLLLTDTVRTLSTTKGPFNSEPGYLQILRLSDAYPILRTVDRVRVEVEPLEPIADFWTFISITNEVTQTVTTITP